MPLDPVTKYAKDVLRGREPACKLVKQACQRHLDDLKRDDVYFDDEYADFVFQTVGLCRHIKGDLAGKPMELHTSQQFIFGSIFGWKDMDTDLRKYRTAYIEVPRKNGKSTILSWLSTYMLALDGEQGAEVYAAATKEDQAKIVWETAWHMVEKSPTLSKVCVNRHNSILHPSTTSKFRPLGSDSKTLDGLNPHAVICDELHAWPNRDLWDVLEDAFGARSQPLMIAITTAGYDKLGICYQQRKHCVQFLDPTSGIKDDRYFAYIATVDDKDLNNPKAKWNPKIWQKANPLLGTSKKLEYMEDQAAKAKAMPGKENTFLNKHLNIWTDGETKWLNMEKWDACGGKIDLKKLKGQKCFSGLDLSSITDITADVLVFPPGPYDEWAILPFFYIPEDNVRERTKRDRVPYEQWISEGLIETTVGDCIDLEFIKKDFMVRGETFSIEECGYDPWKAIEIATALENEGFTMVAMRQGHGTLSAPTAALEKMVLKKQIRHGGNPVLRWMASNAVTRMDPNDNHVPDKKKSAERIDGISATVMALGRAIVAGEDQDPYRDRGIITI